MKKTVQKWAEELNKKEAVKGKDIGRLLIYSYGAELNGTPQVDRALFSSLCNRIPEGKEAAVYDIYSSLYSALVPLINKAKSIEKSLEAYLVNEQKALRDFSELIETREQINSTPYVMSRENYDIVCKACFERLEAIPTYREHFIHQKLLSILMNEEEATEEVKAALNEIADQPIEKSRYKANFTQNYFVLKSGASVREFTEEAYIEALKAWAKTEDTESYLEAVKDRKLRLLYEGGPAIKRAFKSVPSELKGLNDEELEHILEGSIGTPDPIKYKDGRILALDNALGLLPPVKREVRAELSEDVTAYSALAIYCLDYNRRGKSLLEKDYPRLYNALRDIALSRDPSSIGSFSLFNYSDVSQEDVSTETRKRIKRSGIAVIPFTEKYKKISTINGLFSVSVPNNTMKKRYLAQLYCYSIVLEEVIQDFDLECIRDWAETMDFSAPLYPFSNSRLYEAYYSLNKSYSGAELKEQRRAFKEQFKPCPTLEEITPTEEALTTIKERIKRILPTFDEENTLSMFEELTVKLLYINIEGIDDEKY